MLSLKICCINPYNFLSHQMQLHNIYFDLKLPKMYYLQYLSMNRNHKSVKISSRSRSQGTGVCRQTKGLHKHHEQREEAKTCQAYTDTSKPPNDTTYGELRKFPLPIFIRHHPILSSLSAMWKTGTKLWWRTEYLNSYFYGNCNHFRHSQKTCRIIFHFIRRSLQLKSSNFV